MGMQNSFKNKIQKLASILNLLSSHMINIKKDNYSKIDQPEYLQNKNQQTKPKPAYALLS